MNVGDVVRLNSSGLKMTVEYVPDATERQHIGCVWFTKNGKLKRASIKAEVLENAEQVDNEAIAKVLDSLERHLQVSDAVNAEALEPFKQSDNLQMVLDTLESNRGMDFNYACTSLQAEIEKKWAR